STVISFDDISRKKIMSSMCRSTLFSRSNRPRVYKTNSNQRTRTGLPLVLGFAALFLAPVSALAATAPALGPTGAYGLMSSTFTNPTPGTSIAGNVCYTTPPAAAASVTGAIAVPCPPPTEDDQNDARNDLISQACTPIGAAVALNEISIGGGLPGVFPPGCYS